VSTPSSQQLEQLDALMQAYQGTVPGAALLLAQQGVVVVRRAYGLADLETGSAASAATAYRLASITKPLTATATLLLV
jgi:CubicO group peptidase (beta-lactamase class C family)